MKAPIMPASTAIHAVRLALSVEAAAVAPGGEEPNGTGVRDMIIPPEG
jgi:hypothetical protein